jgi:hypothetical protein
VLRSERQVVAFEFDVSDAIVGLWMVRICAENLEKELMGSVWVSTGEAPPL